MELIYEGLGTFFPGTACPETKESPKTVGTTMTSYNLEEISKLKRDIEAIDSLIEDKKKIISENEGKWYYKHRRKLMRVLIVSGLALITALLVSIACLFQEISIDILQILLNLQLYGLSISAASLCLSAFFEVCAECLENENSNLSDTINYLEEIKKQKLSELEQKQRNCSIEQVTQSPREIISQLEFYKEALRVLQNMQKEPSKETIEKVKIIIEEIEEKGKQKTIQRKSLYGE